MQHINHDKQSHQLVKSIISFAKEMNIRTIGEFVSEEKIFETAKQLGVDEYQGYYFGVPSATLH